MNSFCQTATNNFKKDARWPSEPRMKIVWWEILIAMSVGAKTTPEIIKQGSSKISANCRLPGKRVASIARSMVDKKLITVRALECGTLSVYELTDFGKYCLEVYSSAGDEESHLTRICSSSTAILKSDLVSLRKTNLDFKPVQAITKPKVRPALSNWVQFMTTPLVPAMGVMA